MSRADATTPGVGQLYSSPFPIPDYSGDHLMLSDIALGQLFGDGADACCGVRVRAPPVRGAA